MSRVNRAARDSLYSMLHSLLSAVKVGSTAVSVRQFFLSLSLSVLTTRSAPPRHCHRRRARGDPQLHSNAWPFLKPVKKDEVPDYYDHVLNPMGTIGRMGGGSGAERAG